MIAGILSLTSAETLELVDWTNLEVLSGKHLTIPSSELVSSGEFLLVGETTSSLFIPARSEQLVSALSGYIDHSAGLDFAVKSNLSISSAKDVGLDQDSKFIDLLKIQLGDPILGVYSLVMSTSNSRHQGKSSRLVFITRARNLYLWGVLLEQALYLVWSSQPDFPSFISDRWPKAFFYTLPPLVNSISIIQPFYIAMRIKRWQKGGLDTLKMFASIGRTLGNNTRSLYCK